MQLSEVRVLDLTRLLPGPYATQVLADMGADVVKVEEPGTGDYARAMAAGGGPSVFSQVNRGKRSVTLDLKTDRGREAFLRLAAGADVVVEGFRPGVVERLGVGYEAVSDRNPKIVYCSLTGFGATGPNSDRAGHDLNYVGLAGLLDMTRARAREGAVDEPKVAGPPAIPGVPVADMAGGLYAALAVLSSLLARELGDGDGAHLDVAMTDAVLALSQAVAGEAIGGGDPRARETALTGQYPCYDVYETADGAHVTLAALEPAFWRTFCEAVDRPDLVDRHLSADPAERRAVREAVAAVFAERTREEWEAALGDRDAMVAPVRTLREAVESDQATERGLVRSGEAGPRIGLPVRTSDERAAVEESTPDLGEHTAEVLREAGFDDETIAALQDSEAP